MNRLDKITEAICALSDTEIRSPQECMPAIANGAAIQKSRAADREFEQLAVERFASLNGAEGLFHHDSENFGDAPSADEIDQMLDERRELEELCVGAFIRKDADDIARAHIEGVRLVSKKFLKHSSAYKIEVEDTNGNPILIIQSSYLTADAESICRAYLAGGDLPDGFKHVGSLSDWGIDAVPGEIFKIRGQKFSFPRCPV